MTNTTTLDEELEVLIAYEAWALEQNEKTIDTSVGAYARHLERERASESLGQIRTLLANHFSRKRNERDNSDAWVLEQLCAVFKPIDGIEIAV